VFQNIARDTPLTSDSGAEEVDQITRMSFSKGLKEFSEGEDNTSENQSGEERTK
jgi:hypothetical protein